MEDNSNSNSMKGITINKGILDRFLDYTQQTYQAMTSKKPEPEPKLELRMPVSISGVSISGYVKVEGHGDITTELSFFEQYKMLPAELLNIWLKGFVYNLSTPIGTTTISDECPIHRFSRPDDLIVAIISFDKMFKGSKTGPIVDSNVANKAYVGNQLRATEEVSKRGNPEREQLGMEFAHLQMLEIRQDIPDISTQQLEELEKELQTRRPIRAILDSKYYFYTFDEHGKMVFTDPRDRIEKLIGDYSQVNTQTTKTIVDSIGDNIYGYFVEAFVIANIVDGKPDDELSKQILPRGGFLNLASINDWENILDIMGIGVVDRIQGENRKQILTDRLLRAKDLLDQMLTNFYIKTEQNVNQTAFKTENGNVLMGTTLSFWGYMCIVSDFLYQVTKEGNLNGYNPILIFGSSTTFEEFVQKNNAQLSLWVDSNTCAVLSPRKSVWGQIPEDKKSTFLKNFLDDFNAFENMLSQTDTQKEMDKMAIEFPEMFDTIVKELGDAVTANDKKNELTIQKIDAYNLAKKQRAAPPLKITTPIQRTNNPYAASSSAATTLQFSQEEKDEINIFFDEIGKEVDSQTPTQLYSYSDFGAKGKDLGSSLFTSSSSNSSSDWGHEIESRRPYNFSALVPSSSAISSKQMDQVKMDMKASIRAMEEQEKLEKAAIKRESAIQKEAIKNKLWNAPNNSQSLAKQYGMPVVKDTTLAQFTSANTSEQNKKLNAIKQRIEELEFEKNTPLAPPTSWTDTRGTESEIKKLKENKKIFKRLYNVSQKANPLVKSKRVSRTKLPAVINEVGVPIAEVGIENRKRKADPTITSLKAAKFKIGGRKTKKYRQKRQTHNNPRPCCKREGFTKNNKNPTDQKGGKNKDKFFS